MAGLLGFVITCAQIAGGFALYTMFRGELYELPVALVALGVLCAYCLLVCVFLLVLSLWQFYRNLWDEDPASKCYMHSSPPGSFAADLKIGALFLEGLIFMFAITPGESWRAKRGFR
jgi:hypothetical protein